MALSEFDIIRRYFSDLQYPAPGSAAITIGVGDDAAGIRIADNTELVFSIDTQLEGVHFPVKAEPSLIAQRAFRCAISDLAAMGADPLCFTLALTLPAADESWLQAFSAGLRKAASDYRCSLVSGDTTRGPLAITLQVHGIVPQGAAMRRSGARPNDVIFVSGQLGNSAAWVQLMNENRLGDKNMAHACELFSQDYFLPQPQLALGKMLRNHAHSAIDISDGLLADLGHLCSASRVKAEIQLDKLPLSPELRQTFSESDALRLALTGGDDYQLCFTVPENKWRKIVNACDEMECPVTIIGRVLPLAAGEVSAVACYDKSGARFDTGSLTATGYSHF